MLIHLSGPGVALTSSAPPKTHMAWSRSRSRKFSSRPTLHGINQQEGSLKRKNCVEHDLDHRQHHSPREEKSTRSNSLHREVPQKSAIRSAGDEPQRRSPHTNCSPACLIGSPFAIKCLGKLLGDRGGQNFEVARDLVANDIHLEILLGDLVVPYCSLCLSRVIFHGFDVYNNPCRVLISRGGITSRPPRSIVGSTNKRFCLENCAERSCVSKYAGTSTYPVSTYENRE